MTYNQNNKTIESGPSPSGGGWDLRHPGLVMTGSNGEEIHEFTGMWPLKPDADLVTFVDSLSIGPASSKRNERSVLRGGQVRTAQSSCWRTIWARAAAILRSHAGSRQDSLAGHALR